jgi:hypothetical protein
MFKYHLTIEQNSFNFLFEPMKPGKFVMLFVIYTFQIYKKSNL